VDDRAFAHHQKSEKRVDPDMGMKRGRQELEIGRDDTKLRPIGGGGARRKLLGEKGGKSHVRMGTKSYLGAGEEEASGGKIVPRGGSEAQTEKSTVFSMPKS